LGPFTSFAIHEVSSRSFIQLSSIAAFAAAASVLPLELLLLMPPLPLVLGLPDPEPKFSRRTARNRLSST
jgi:hypothetical protein